MQLLIIRKLKVLNEHNIKKKDLVISHLIIILTLWYGVVSLYLLLNQGKKVFIFHRWYGVWKELHMLLPYTL